MKTGRTLLLVILLILVLTVPSLAAMPSYVTIAFSSVGGIWHAVAEATGELLRNNVKGLSVDVIPGAAAGNVVRVQNGDIELALTQSMLADDAATGSAPFEAPLPSVKALTTYYSSVAQFFILARTGITSIEQIREEQYPLKVSVHTRGSGIEANARRMLEEYGITYDDISSWGGEVLFVGMAEAARMMGDGLLDAYIGVTIAPESSFVDLASRRNLNMLPVSQEVVAALVEKYTVAESTVRGGLYRGIDEDVNSFAVNTVLIAHEDLDEEFVYQVVKAIAENTKFLGEAHASLRDISPGYMSQGTGFPLHPGALRYYQEVGVIK